VFVVAGLMVAALLALSGSYGFHGDEMYFVVAGPASAFGYVDQPPLTPLLSAASVAILGVSPTAVRVLPALEMGTAVLLVALIARDLRRFATRARVSPPWSPRCRAISGQAISTPRPSLTCSPGR
jgi:hypothetical protein